MHECKLEALKWPYVQCLDIHANMNVLSTGLNVLLPTEDKQSQE